MKTLKPIAEKIVMGDQVRETCCAKFGADQCAGVFGGNMPIFLLSFFLYKRLIMIHFNNSQMVASLLHDVIL